MSEYPQQKLKKEWIQESISDETVTWAKSFGKYLQSHENKSEPLSTSQIRRFFGEIKRIQADPIKYKNDIPLLKAKLAYSVGRDIKKDRNGQVFNKTKIKEFYEVLESGIDFVRKEKKEDFINFVKIVESIVAYHKYFGGE